MIKTPVLPLIILVLAVSARAAAQDSYFPSVSRIRAESRNNLVRLTWTDSPDARGPVYIYRSARPFSGSVPGNIRPVVVAYGAEYYIDDIEDMGNVYYFIAVSDVSGRRYETIIPYINTTSVDFVEAETFMPAEAEVLRGLSSLKAVQVGNRIVVTFDTPEPNRSAVLYRSAQPVRQPRDLLGAVIVAAGTFAQYTDFPLPGAAWYYAIIFEDEISSGTVVIRPGLNATVSPVFIYSENAANDFMRPIPLPLLTIGSEMPGGFLSDVTNEAPLSTASINMLNRARMPSKLPLEAKRPRVYVVDMEAPASGEDSALFQIVNEYFLKMDWERALVNLQRYLSLPRSREVEARARFYLGQTLYYNGNYKDALWEFLSYKLFNSVEAAAWIEAVLAAMVY